jgi:mono/diheme cytochrome c family protein
VLDLDAPPAEPARVVVGDVSSGPFPSTDAELGEAFNTMTAAFGVDGDQTCAHCHRDGSPIGKPVAMPLLEQPAWGIRNVMAYRGAYDTRPWFLEVAMEQDNFFAVINELARKENFCCEMTDIRVWSHYPARDACTASPELEGCNHVLDCESHPPPECAARNYGGASLTRDQHFRAAALRVLGRDTSFGDGLFGERLRPDGTIERRPIPLGFDGITRALGLFLLSDSRLLPSPERAVQSARVRVGEALFSSTRTGCAGCHPLPVTSTALPTPMGEVPGPLSFGYVVSPLRHPVTGADVDRVNAGFLGTFTSARQTETGLRVGVTQLRGAWDRVTFLHHGQARSLRETLATPSHPVLREGERGFNELDGQPDTHGATSGLSRDELEALIAYVETL